MNAAIALLESLLLLLIVAALAAVILPNAGAIIDALNGD